MPLGVAQQRLRADADEAVVRVGILLLDVMHVIGGDELQAELLRPGNEVAIDLGLLGDAVVLEFEVKIFRAEGLLEPVDRLARLGQLVLEDGFGNFAGEAAGQRDEAVLVRGEQFLVNARLVIIALQMRARWRAG